ncbi:MAG: alpha-L-fucosidase [Bacteroidales bacterium]
MKTYLLFACMILLGGTAISQHSQQYFPERDPAVLSKLEQWQDLKFGLLMHWGPYSQWGVVESWSICGEDEDWCRRNVDNYFKYLTDYENLKTTFNPVNFDPSKWAKASWDAGMRYVVFTTKHHDGFCMFDTRQTDYKITDPACPFSKNSKANIAREVFKSFRQEGLWTGAYFSKPDWHSEYYWWRNFPTPDRNVNYDITKYPERWEKYVQFTHNQILELMSEYGSMDILWLDGGWVQKRTKESIIQDINSPNYKFTREQSQDIRMDELVARVRKKQPGLIVVDRAVQGINQNYLTPENQVPDKTLPYPWESCIIAGGGWSWVPNAKYKSAREVVHLLSDIVCKGGNLLLNIAPGPDGSWDNDAYTMLAGVGKWMKLNSEAIYNTRSIPPYRQGDVCYTRKNGSEEIFAIYLVKEDAKEFPEELSLLLDHPLAVKDIKLLATNQKMKWTKNKSGLTIYFSTEQRKEMKHGIAWAFKIEN